jgi:hypothetical protein
MIRLNIHSSYRTKHLYQAKTHLSNKLPKKIRNYINCKKNNESCDEIWDEIENIVREVEKMDDNIKNTENSKDDRRWDIC